MLAENLSALQHRYSNINWYALAQLSLANSSFTLSKARNGSPTITINNQALHSLYNPEQEAYHQLAHLKSTADSFIILGLGMGYLAEALYALQPEKPLLIVEPNLELFLITTTQRNLSSLILAPNIIFLIQQPTAHLINTCQTLALKQTQQFVHRPLEQLYPEIYTHLNETLAQYKLQKKTNYDTVKKYGALWIRHLIQNLPLWSNSHAVCNLFGQFKDYPALIVAAGPSLQKLLPWLPQLAERTLIICVDTAVRFVHRAGVTPDIIVAIDSQYWNSRHFDYCDFRTSLLVADPSLYPTILRRCPSQQRYLMSSLFPFGTALESAVTPFGTLRSGGSVATTTWDLARALGCATLWCVGLDLAYPHGETHASGALFEEWAFARSTRFESTQNAFMQLMHPQQLMVQGVLGEPIKTDIRMNIYRQWLESVAHEASTFNLSQGAMIQGIPLASLAELLTYPPIRAILTEKLNSLRLSHNVQTMTLRTASLRKMRENFMQELTSLSELATQARALTLSLIDKPHNEQLVHKLAHIDQALQCNEAKKSLNFLFDPIFADFLTKLATHPEQTLDTSLALYQKIIELATYYNALFKTYEPMA
jgi:hypothetical protein